MPGMPRTVERNTPQLRIHNVGTMNDDGCVCSQVTMVQMVRHIEAAYIHYGTCIICCMRY